MSDGTTRSRAIGRSVIPPFTKRPDANTAGTPGANIELPGNPESEIPGNATITKGLNESASRHNMAAFDQTKNEIAQSKSQQFTFKRPSQRGPANVTLGGGRGKNAATVSPQIDTPPKQESKKLPANLPQSFQRTSSPREKEEDLMDFLNDLDTGHVEEDLMGFLASLSDAGQINSPPSRPKVPPPIIQTRGSEQKNIGSDDKKSKISKNPPDKGARDSLTFRASKLFSPRETSITEERSFTDNEKNKPAVLGGDRHDHTEASGLHTPRGSKRFPVDSLLSKLPLSPREPADSEAANKLFLASTKDFLAIMASKKHASVKTERLFALITEAMHLYPQDWATRAVKALGNTAELLVSNHGLFLNNLPPNTAETLTSGLNQLMFSLQDHLIPPIPQPDDTTRAASDLLAGMKDNKTLSGVKTRLLIGFTTHAVRANPGNWVDVAVKTLAKANPMDLYSMIGNHGMFLRTLPAGHPELEKQINLLMFALQDHLMAKPKERLGILDKISGTAKKQLGNKGAVVQKNTEVPPQSPLDIIAEDLNEAKKEVDSFLRGNGRIEKNIVKILDATQNRLFGSGLIDQIVEVSTGISKDLRFIIKDGAIDLDRLTEDQTEVLVAGMNRVMDYIFNTHPNDMLSPEGIAVLRMIDRTIKDEDNPINASTSAVFFLRGVVPTIFEVVAAIAKTSDSPRVMREVAVMRVISTCIMKLAGDSEDAFKNITASDAFKTAIHTLLANRKDSLMKFMNSALEQEPAPGTND